jgi:hypothetical protein
VTQSVIATADHLVDDDRYFRFRFVEDFGRLTLAALERRTHAVSEVMAFADLADSPSNRSKALNQASSLATTPVRTVRYSSPLEIVVAIMLGASGAGLAFRLIKLGERLADLRDRWARSTTNVARAEMQTAYYRMLEEQLLAAGMYDPQKHLEALRPLTEIVSKGLIEIESIEEVFPSEVDDGK